jgi:hypothetical protein
MKFDIIIIPDKRKSSESGEEEAPWYDEVGFEKRRFTH